MKKIYAGRSSEELTERGIRQAEKVTEKLKRYKVSAVYSSPIQRAIQTAEIICQGIGIDLRIEDAFREMELGSWEGMSENKIARIYPEEWNIWNSRPADLRMAGRETLHELQERVLKGVQNIKTNSNLAVITHVAIIRVLMLWHAQKSLNLYKTIHVPNAEIFVLKIDSSP